MYSALNSCHTADCNSARAALNTYIQRVNYCWTFTSWNNLNSMIKVTIPPAGQQEIAREWEDVDRELKEFGNSTYAHNIDHNLDQWSESQQAKNLRKTLH